LARHRPTIIQKVQFRSSRFDPGRQQIEKRMEQVVVGEAVVRFSSQALDIDAETGAEAQNIIGTWVWTRGARA
jgi:hypothetical protein